MATSNTTTTTTAAAVAGADALQQHLNDRTFPSVFFGNGIETAAAALTARHNHHPPPASVSHPQARHRIKKAYPHEDLPRRLSHCTPTTSRSSSPTRSSSVVENDFSFLEEEDLQTQPAQQFEEVSFFQDFVAGGIAGSASVIVGHPFDTMKVRVQASSGSGGVLSTLAEFGGVSSLFRGIGGPLASAAVINAVIFSSYGSASKIYDLYVPTTTTNDNVPGSLFDSETDDNNSSASTRDPWQKSTICGAFAGIVQCFIVCPMEHIKCRFQVQTGAGAYSGPLQAMTSIVKQHGISRLYQGWWSCCWREIPAFGLYFASYDMIKDHVNDFVFSDSDESETSAPPGTMHTKAWLSSAIAGGFAGAITWGMVYPVDVIKTRIQTAPLDTPRGDLTIWKVGRTIVNQHGWRYLFRGLGITLIRAFPVNATLFPIYEFTLLQIQAQSASMSPSSPGVNYSIFQ
ncbi:hypothetical protein ACA910_003150 [Epithemia clementina (nom. ined.)]